MATKSVSSKQPYPSKYVEVFGSKMHFVETGEGEPILFLHGMPTSSYLWRNVIPYLAPLGRCIALDLIGMGGSDKPDIEYTVFDHIKYVEKFIEVLGLKNLTLVMHGWGSVIGLDYAMRHEKKCKGLAFYEAFLQPLPRNGEEKSLPFLEQMTALKELVNDDASFIDKIIPPIVMRKMNEEEMACYRQPFIKKGSAKPILQYLKELPYLNNVTKVDELIQRYTKQLIHSSLPKLMMYSVPGFITTMEMVIWAKERLTNIEVVDIGEELHLAQESNPVLVGKAISVWLQGTEKTRGVS